MTSYVRDKSGKKRLIKNKHCCTVGNIKYRNEQDVRMSTAKIEVRNYSNHQEYIDHQKSKADHGTPLYNLLLNELLELDCGGFRENFRPYTEMLSGCRNALCLGARTGQEVFVLRELGVEEAIGIDLVATPPIGYGG